MTALHKTHTATFSSALAEVEADTKGGSLFCGDGAELFSSGSAPQMRSCLSGENTALFSSGSAPTAEAVVVRGDLSGLFSSGS